MAEGAGRGSPLFAFLALALLLSPFASATAQPADNVIVAAGPMSGQKSALGLQVRQAAELAVGDLNAAGRIPGGRLRLLTVDDACDAQAATAAAQSVLNLKPVLVVGHPCAAAAIAAARVYAAAGILFIATGVRHPALTDKRPGPFVFRLAGRDDREGAEAAAQLAALAGGRPIAVVHDRTAYARTLATDVLAALARRGLAASALPITAGAKDYAAEIARIGAAGSGAVFFAGFPMEAGILLRQMLAAKVAAPFIGSDAVATRELGEAAGAAAEGAEALVPYDASKSSSARRLASRLEIGADAAGPMLPLVYAAVEVWGSAVERAGSVEAGAVAAALRTGEQVTSLGPLTFDAKGDALLRSYVVVRWKAGAWAAPDGGEPEK